MLGSTDMGRLRTQSAAFNGQQLVVTDSTDGVIDHRTFWLDSNIFHKLLGVAGIIGILDTRELSRTLRYHSTRYRRKST